MKMARPLTGLILLLLALAGTASAQFVTTSPLPNGNLNLAYATGIQTVAPFTGWTISKGALPPGLGIDNNGNITGTPTAVGNFGFEITGQDVSSFIVYTQGYSLKINPALSITTSPALPPVTVGGTYPVTTLQAANGNGLLTWFSSASPPAGAGKLQKGIHTAPPQGLPPGMSFDPAGVLSGTPTLVGVFQFFVTVFDSSVPAGQVATSVFVLTVNPPASGSGQLPNGFVGQAYSQALPVTGGTGPFTFTLNGGALPPGLTLGPDGTLAGVPTATGTYQVAMLLKDAYGILGGASYTLAILPTGVSILTQSLADGTVGQAYSQALAATGGKAPYQWTKLAGALPDGLTLDPAGAIAGTPTKVGAFGLTLRVTDASGSTGATGSVGSSDSRDYRIIIVTGPPIIATPSLLDGTVSSPYSQTLTAAGGTAPYSWNLDTGSLPAGLTLDAASGTISGTPTATGTATFTVRVSDAREGTATKVLQLKIGAPAIPASDLPGIPATLPPADQNDVQVHLASPYPLPIQGRINLGFSPGPPNGDDPAVQFSTGGRSVEFSIPAGASDALFLDPAVLIQTGTVAGTITLTVQYLVDGVDLTPQPAPARTIQILPAAPVISQVVASRTSTGISVAITGFSNTREVATATFKFPAAASSHLTTSSITIPATPLFSPYYGDEASVAFGSLFAYVQSFTINGTASDVQQVGVVLTNTVGASAEVTVAIQ